MTDREQFEAWAADKGYPMEREAEEDRATHGYYVHSVTEDAFEVWQAARAAPAQEEPSVILDHRGGGRQEPAQAETRLYEAQFIERDSDGRSHWRITHIPTDSRIATCYVKENADMVVAALNGVQLEPTEAAPAQPEPYQIVAAQRSERERKKLAQDDEPDIDDLSRASEPLKVTGHLVTTQAAPAQKENIVSRAIKGMRALEERAAPEQPAERVLLRRWKNPSDERWEQARQWEVDGDRLSQCEYAWATIELEGK